MADIRYRLAGLAFLVASAGSTAIHRAIYEAAKRGPAQLGELALGLSSFILASIGILLLVHGGRLFAARTPAHQARTPRAGRRTADTPLGYKGHEAVDGREGMALILANRAIAATSAGVVATPSRRHLLS